MYLSRAAVLDCRIGPLRWSALVLGLLCVAAEARAYEPSMNYTLHCMGCHTPDGSGTPDRVPSVRETLLAFSKSPAGREFLVQVPGSAQSSLSSAELSELLNWMIQNLSSEPKPRQFEPFTESEVARYRTRSLFLVKEARERLIRATLQPNQGSSP